MPSESSPFRVVMSTGLLTVCDTAGSRNETAMACAEENDRGLLPLL
jgi:hypothetical protein